MRQMCKCLIKSVHLAVAAFSVSLAIANVSPSASAAEIRNGVPILVYHRFGPVAADSMTVTTAVFQKQLEWLRGHQVQILPLRMIVDSVRGTGLPIGGRAVVITVDDAHRSVYADLFPLIKRLRFPVTLFVYPSAVSNAPYAMTWPQIEEMAKTGLVDVQSHTFWHPNFKHEKARLSPDKYRVFVESQFLRSKAIISEHVKSRVDMLAWPFGIHDPELEKMAENAGYIAAFTLDRRPVLKGSSPLSLPRYLITDGDRGARFAAIASGTAK